MDERGQFTEPIEGSAGILIRHENVEVVEFLSVAVAKEGGDGEGE